MYSPPPSNLGLFKMQRRYVPLGTTPAHTHTHTHRRGERKGRGGEGGRGGRERGRERGREGGRGERERYESEKRERTVL